MLPNRPNSFYVGVVQSILFHFLNRSQRAKPLCLKKPFKLEFGNKQSKLILDFSSHVFVLIIMTFFNFFKDMNQPHLEFMWLVKINGYQVSYVSILNILYSMKISVVSTP